MVDGYVPGIRTPSWQFLRSKVVVTCHHRELNGGRVIQDEGLKPKIEIR